MKVKPRELSIGQLAARTGVTTRALRHYDGRGLLPSRRDTNGYRRFDPGAVVVVERIRTLLLAGYDLRLVERLLECSAADGGIDLCPEVAAQMRQVLARKDAEAARLQDQTRLIREHLRP